MSKKKPKEKQDSWIIARNKKASFEYHLEQKFEAGLVLLGWEVKSLRSNRVQMQESHVIMRDGEAWLLNLEISPLPEASKHTEPKPTRTRKLLLNKKELNKLIGAVERSGYTVIPVYMYWKNGKAKIEIALAKGKKLHDKRQSMKDRDWSRDKQRLLKSSNR